MLTVWILVVFIGVTGIRWRIRTTTKSTFIRVLPVTSNLHYFLSFPLSSKELNEWLNTPPPSRHVPVTVKSGGRPLSLVSSDPRKSRAPHPSLFLSIYYFLNFPCSCNSTHAHIPSFCTMSGSTQFQIVHPPRGGGRRRGRAGGRRTL